MNDRPTSPIKWPVPNSQASQVRKTNGYFIRGPIPLPWMSKAAHAPGKALAVALAVWFRHGCSQGKPVRLNPATLQKFGIGRQSAYRGLKSLEVLGLVKVNRGRGRCPVVEVLLDALAPASTEEGATDAVD